MTSDHIDSASSSSLPTVSCSDSTIFSATVAIVNLERASLSRRLEKVQCLLACDDTASVNLYLDQRQEVDYIQFRLTNGIRQLFVSDKTATVKVQLSTQQRLEITPETKSQCQILHDLLLQVKNKPNDTSMFPRHQPKVGILKPDTTSAYLTANDMPTDMEFGSLSAAGTVLLTPAKRRAAVQRAAVIPEQTHKKTRMQHIEYTSHRKSKETYDLLASSPTEPENSPGHWHLSTSPALTEEEIMTTPRRSSSKYTLLRQQESSDRAKVLSLLSISSEKPRFHSTIPTPRVLRSMNDRSRRYGCDIETRKSKRLSSPDRSSNSRCIAAVLRALFSTDLVARDLGEPYWLRVSGPRQSLYRSLVETFAPYSKNEYAEVKEDIVSENVIKSSKGRLGDEDDAREFLNDTLNQVRQEFRERSTNKTCPLSRLFECNIDHTLVCLDCGNRIVQTEHYQDFCLELPACDSNRSSQRAVSIGGLFPQVFDTQHISFQCEACHSESAMVHRSISKLPEVLVVYLKRFTSRPNNGYNKNRSRVAIDDSLEFSQFCSSAAFMSDLSISTIVRYSEDEGEHGYPSIPSDSPPSSSSQCFSSISPVERDDSFSSFSTPLAPGTIAHDYIDADLYNSLAHGNSAANPHLLNSDDDNDDDTDQLYDNSRSFSVYDAPSEDEQYHWAMEESIRASQSLSQESTLSGGNIQPSESEMGALLPDGLKTPTVMLDSDNALDAKFLLTKKLEEKSSVSWDSSSRKGNGSGKDDGTSDEEDVDEQIKAAIRASLLSVELQNEAAPLTEQELQEQENKQLEEAIRRSLLDTEENKENISPEKGRSGKKKKGYVTKAKDRDKETITGAHPRGLTRSCSQSQMATSASFRTTTCSAASAAFTTARPRLLRAHTVDVLAKFEMSSSQEKEEQVGQVSMSRRTRSSCSMDILNKDNNRQKGKDKAPSKVQTATREHTKGLFQLQAMVSHTGLVSSSSEGHYVCDSRGADGIWRSYDGGKRTRIGSIAELSQYRGRSGYLFFYVHQSLAA